MQISTDIVGYAASGLVLLTFVMKDMRPLRVTAILSNLAFIAYGAMHALPPVLCLHCACISRCCRSTSRACANSDALPVRHTQPSRRDRWFSPVPRSRSSA
jgi:hypothetical protein